MTPAEQIRATMSLLEGIVDEDTLDQQLKQIVNGLPDLDNQLDEGKWTKALAGLAIGATMALAGNIAHAQSTAGLSPETDAKCAGIYLGLAKLYQQDGRQDLYNNNLAAAKHLIQRASSDRQYGQNSIAATAAQEANNVANKVLTDFNSAPNIDAGVKQLNNLVDRCVVYSTKGINLDKEEAEAAKQKADQARAAQQSRGFSITAQAQADGTIARSLMANGMAAQAKELLSKYVNNEPARQAFMRAYNGQR